MHVNHSYSASKDISNSIMNGQFKFTINDRLCFGLSIENLDLFIANGLELSINVREYKELVAKNIQNSTNYWLSRSLIQMFTSEDIEFDVDWQKLTYVDKETFTPEVINLYFSNVYQAMDTYVKNKESAPLQTLPVEVVSITEEGMSITVDGFTLLISKENQKVIFEEITKYFNTYYEASLTELKHVVVNSDKYVDYDFILNTGLSVIKSLSTQENLSFEDMKNIIDTFIPYKFCHYLDC